MSDYIKYNNYEGANMKKFISVILAFILIFSTLSGIFTFETHAEENASVSQEDVVAVAVNMMMNTFPFEDGIHQPFRLRSIEDIYDVNGNIASYYVTFEDLNGNYCGYVIVSASKLQNPVMEFAVGKGSFIEESKNSIAGAKQNCKLIYLGDGIYGVRQSNDILYEMTPAGCVEADEAGLLETSAVQNFKSEKTENYNALWNEQISSYNKIYKNDKLKAAYSSDDPREGLIYNPEEYEYTSAVEKIVPGGNMYYFTMKYFADGGVCSPAAATNLCYYWYRRDSSHFAGLYRNSWQNVFNTLAEYMETDTETGTANVNAYNGYRWYFNEAGIRYSLNYYSQINKEQVIVDEINAGYPAHLVLNAHNEYKYHSVLAIGYKQFNYASEKSTYIRIADGWGENNDTIHLPNRYVWGGCQGWWNYFSFRPEGY